MTDVRGLLGLTEQEAAGMLAARAEKWTCRRCESGRPRPEGLVERVVRALRLDDGTVELTLSGFCDYPRGVKEEEHGSQPAGT